jgi:hypothetical protein
VVAQGYVRDPTGVPVSGATVSLYRDPAVDSAATVAPLATATTDTVGFFVLRSANTSELQQDAAANGGHVNFDVMASAGDAPYYEAVTRVYSAAGAARWLTPEQAVAEDPALEPDEQLDVRPVPQGSLAAGDGPAVGSPWCLLTYKTKTLVSTERDPTVIGELLVGEDATGTFSFGEGAHTISNISVGLNFGHGWTVGAFKHASTGNSTGVSISNTTENWAHVLLSDYVYAKYRKQTVSHITGEVCSTWYTIEPKEWVGGGIVAGADESEFLHKCLTTYSRWVIDQGPNSTWYRNRNKLKTWGAAVTVGLGSGGLDLSGWTGSSQWARYDYSFGTRGDHHYLCGSDAVPKRSSRIFAGG